MGETYINPWDRQENETEKQYDYFKEYLALPPPRRYHKVAQIKGVTDEYMRMLSIKNNWQDRVRRYDSWVNSAADNIRSHELAVFQQQVIADEVEDYVRMRNRWQQMLSDLDNQYQSGEIDISEYIELTGKLVRSRSAIDSVARKSASLPNVYRAKPSGDLEKAPESGPLVLTIDGPRRLVYGDDEED